MSSEQSANSSADDICITIDDLNKWYGNFHVLRDINLNVKKGASKVISVPSF